MGPSTSHEAVGILMQPANTISKSFLWMHVHPDEPVYVFDTQVHTYIYIDMTYTYIYFHMYVHIYLFLCSHSHIFSGTANIFIYISTFACWYIFYHTCMKPRINKQQPQDSWWFLHIYCTILRNMGRLEIRDALRLLSFLHGEMDDAPLAHAIFPNN